MTLNDDVWWMLDVLIEKRRWVEGVGWVTELPLEEITTLRLRLVREEITRRRRIMKATKKTEALSVAIDFLDAWCDQFDEEHEDYERNHKALETLSSWYRERQAKAAAVV
jgi:hypothetical protein